MRQISPYIAIIILLFAQNARANKIDTIYLQHGDRITGEVKSLENNYLKLSTDDLSTISIKWNKVDSVKILNNMRIVFEEGEIFYGKLLTAGKDGYCYIWANVGEPRLTHLTEIVMLSPLEKRFMDRLTGTLSAGFSYTKANDILQLNLDASVKYQAEKIEVELSYNGNFTSQDTLDATQRTSSGITFRRLLPNNWFLVSELGTETNSEQNLDLRTSVSLGGGNSIVNTNRSALRIAGALQGSREYSQEDVQNSIEAVLGAGYYLFVYDSPKITFNFISQLSPSLSDMGRIRADIDSNISWEIFHDFYLKWTFYYSFDSKPLSATASKNDWAVTLLGIEYKL